MRNRDTPARPIRNGDKLGGLTKREECAMRFMQSILEDPDGWASSNFTLAKHAVRFADALFDELEKTHE